MLLKQTGFNKILLRIFTSLHLLKNLKISTFTEKCLYALFKIVRGHYVSGVICASYMLMMARNLCTMLQLNGNSCVDAVCLKRIAVICFPFNCRNGA